MKSGPIIIWYGRKREENFWQNFLNLQNNDTNRKTRAKGIGREYDQAIGRVCNRYGSDAQKNRILEAESDKVLTEEEANREIEEWLNER